GRLSVWPFGPACEIEREGTQSCHGGRSPCRSAGCKTGTGSLGLGVVVVLSSPRRLRQAGSQEMCAGILNGQHDVRQCSGPRWRNGPGEDVGMEFPTKSGHGVKV